MREVPVPRECHKNDQVPKVIRIGIKTCVVKAHISDRLGKRDPPVRIFNELNFQKIANCPNNFGNLFHCWNISVLRGWRSSAREYVLKINLVGIVGSAGACRVYEHGPVLSADFFARLSSFFITLPRILRTEITVSGEFTFLLTLLRHTWCGKSSYSQLEKNSR